MVVGDVVVNNARNHPNKLGLVDEQGVRLTWKEVNSRVNRLANALLALGLRKGDRLAMISENCSQYAEFYFAAAKVGLIGVGVNYRLGAKELSSIINDCEPKAIIVQNKFAPVINSVSSNLNSVKNFIGLGEDHGYTLDYESSLANYPLDEPPSEVREEDIFKIIYTTGSTGLPKGVPITHKHQVMTDLMGCIHCGYTADDVIEFGLPLHAAGGHWRFFPPCMMGATMIIIVFKGKTFVEMVEKERVTVCQVGTTRFRLIREYLDSSERKYDLSSLRNVAIPAGEETNAETVREILGFFKPSISSRCYGMTEANSVPVAFRFDVARVGRRELESIGKPLLNTQARIVDENGQDVARGGVGEIWLKGDLIAKGYWNKPDLTKERFREGWFNTNDLGVVDEDGYMYYRGRKGSMIKSGAFFVAPMQVEKVILQHPGVAEVAVVGVPDEKWGEAVTAFVALKKGDSASEEDIKAHCRKELAGYQVPKRVHFVDELPRSADVSKVLLHELKKRSI